MWNYESQQLTAYIYSIPAHLLFGLLGYFQDEHLKPTKTCGQILYFTLSALV